MNGQTVGNWHSQRRAMEIERIVCRAVRGGTTSMRAARTALTPMDFREQQQVEEYNKRLARTVLFPAYDDAIGSIVDKPFQRPIELKEADGLSENLQKLEFDCDREGTPLTEFARTLLDSIADTGLAFVLVDKPGVMVEEGEGDKRTVRPMNLAEEEANDIRPYFAAIHPDAVLSWSWRMANGKRILSMIALFDESVEVNPDTGMESAVHTVRVWTETEWQVWRRFLEVRGIGATPSDASLSIQMTAQQAATSTAASEKAPYQLASSGPNPLGKVPVVWRNVSQRGGDPLVARPPLMDLAWKNVDDWLVTSSLSNNLHWHGLPMMVVAGAPNDVADGTQRIVFGAGAMLASSSADLAVSFVESSGAAATQLAARLAMIRQEEQQLGLAPFLDQVTAGTTATATDAAGARTQSRVQSWCECLEWLLYDAFRLAAEWEGEELPEDFDIDIFRDFGLPTRAQTDLQILTTARQSKEITQATYLRELKKRGTLGDEVDIDAEVAETSAEGPDLASMLGGAMQANLPDGNSAMDEEEDAEDDQPNDRRSTDPLPTDSPTPAPRR